MWDVEGEVCVVVGDITSAREVVVTRFHPLGHITFAAAYLTGVGTFLGRAEEITLRVTA